MKGYWIAGVHIMDRIRHVGEVQKLLTEYGCHIKTRLGLHETDENICSPNGLLLLELVGDEKKCQELIQKLGAVEGVQIQTIRFSS